MKITFVTLSLGSGGAERVVSVLANQFVKLGHDVGIILTANDNICYPLSDKIKIICLKDDWNINQNTFCKVYKRIRSIRKTIKMEKPDIVISFLSVVNMETSVALINLPVPLIASERNDPAIDPPGKLKKILRRFVYMRPDGFVFQTQGARDYFGRRIRSKSTIILNPLTASLPEYYAGEREKRVVAVGRLEKQKNYPMLLDAFEAFHRGKPDYTLEIYGEGVLEKELTAMIEKKGMSDYVKLMGFCKDIHERINKATLFVMTSDYEGLPNALIEAMALGLPCISTDCPCGGPRTLINNGENGILVDTGDTMELIKAMNEILKESQYRRIGEKAKEIKGKVNLELVTGQWLQYIMRIKGQQNK